MLKDLKKAVNSFVYSPTESKLANCRLQVTELVQFLQSIEVPKEEAKKPKASKSKSKASKPKATPKPKASKSSKPKASKSSSKTGRVAEIEAILSSGKKMKRKERSVLNKELFALLSAERRSSKKSKSKAVRRPKRTSEAGLELTQAKTATANKVGKVKKTKVVNAADGGEPQPFEPRKEVPVVEPKVRKKEQMKVTLLEGETPQEAMARLRSAEIEAARLEALALIAETAPF